MKKRLRNKVLIALTIFSLVGGVTVYATTDIDEYIKHLMRIIFDIKQSELDNKIMDQMRDESPASTIDIEEYLDDASNRVMVEVEKHAETKMVHANEELITYLDSLLEQLEDHLEDESERLKTLTTERVNQFTDVLKDELYFEFTTNLENYQASYIN